MAHDELFQGGPAPIPENPSHADILMACRRMEDHISVWVAAQQRHIAAVTKTADTVDRLEKSIGWSGKDQHGEIVGEGLMGDFARLDKRVTDRFYLQDGWRRYIAGALGATLVLLAAIWWLVEGKLSDLFR